MGPADPAAAFAESSGALDLRPGGPVPPGWSGPVVVAGPDDLAEVRVVVETAVGVGSWPSCPFVEGRRLRGVVRPASPSVVAALLLAMEGLIERRSPWSRWRSVVETLAAPLSSIETLTIDAVVLDFADRRPAKCHGR